VTAITTETVVLARHAPLMRAIAADHARRNVVVVAPHNATMHRVDPIEIAGHPNRPRRPHCPLKSRFNPKTRDSPE
jgi:hypothetical protein